MLAGHIGIVDLKGTLHGATYIKLRDFDAEGLATLLMMQTDHIRLAFLSGHGIILKSYGNIHRLQPPVL